MEWISVKDELPANDDEVLVFGSSGMFNGFYHAEMGYWCSEKNEHVECREEFEPVTHWMHLPPEPFDLKEIK